MSTPLEQALGRLVADGTLTGDQANAVTREVQSLAAQTLPAQPLTRGRSRPAWTDLVAEIGAYVGGAFVLAAALVLLGPNWYRFGQGERLAIMAVPAFVLLAAAAVVLATTPGGWPVRHRRGTGARRRLSASLVVVGAALTAGAAIVLWDTNTGWETVLWFATAAVVCAAGYAVLRHPLLHVATATGTAGAAAAAGPELVTDWQWDGAAAGGALVLVALVWLALTVAGVLAEAALGLTVAGVVAFVGSEAVALGDRAEWAGFVVLGVLAVAGLVGYVRTRHVGVLVVGVVALATVVPQAVVHYTEGELGAAGALLVTGLSILGASVLGLRLRSATTDGGAAPPAQPPLPAG